MKRKFVLLAVIVAILALVVATVAFASPFWFDNFDSYANGTVLQGVGGWKGWDNTPAAAGTVSNAQAHSGPNSVAIGPAADAVREFTGYGAGGVYDITAWTYVPSAMTGEQYFIVLNTYADLGTNNWSTQILFNASTDLVSAVDFGTTTTLLEDQWVELRVHVDLNPAVDQQTIYYNGVQFAQGSWTDGASGGGALNIDTIDLFGNGASTMYYDDISIVDAARSVSVEKTASTDGSCGTSNNITADYNSMVTYCYQITNTGNVTYTAHMVMDDQLGMVLPTTGYALAPGDYFSFTVDALFNEESVTNVMTWTAWVSGTSVITSGTASATVTGQPTDVALTTFGGNGSMAWLLPVASLMVLALLAGAMVLRRRNQN